MENPFETISRRLSNIEDLLIDIKHRPSSSLINTAPPLCTKIDFVGMCHQYFPNIPPNTVRQHTAKLSRTKIGKRVLFDRSEVEQLLQEKHQLSVSEIEKCAETSVNTRLQNQRVGGRQLV